jgi:hypothetical protein
MGVSVCSTTGANTGGIDCEKKMGVPKKPILGSKSFTSVDYASVSTFDTALLAAINQAAGSASKLFPFPEIQGNTDNTEANTEGTLGYGLKIITKEGRPAYQFQVLCGPTQFKQMRRFNRTRIPVFVLDDQNLIWGRKTAAGNFEGLMALIFVSGNGFEDANTVEKVAATVTISFESASDFYDSSVYTDTNLAVADIVGLVDAPLASVGTVAATTKFEIKIPYSKIGNYVNLYDTYETELASASMWEAHTGATFGTSLALTGVTANDSDKTWSVAFDSTAYSALASAAQIRVRLKPPATLYAANVKGIEGIAVVIAKP